MSHAIGISRFHVPAPAAGTDRVRRAAVQLNVVARFGGVFRIDPEFSGTPRIAAGLVASSADLVA